MDTDNALWSSSSDQATRDTLFQLMRCPLDSDAVTASQIGQVACNWFVAQGLKQLNDINDFTKDTNGTANEIADYVRAQTDTWSSLGLMFSSSTRPSWF